ncbi:hypothetical protein FACS1894216_19020 [Synergistales bacterium]|nr:hypothetical protein FACS1894216_19020 [Synergistales bacterium]
MNAADFFSVINEMRRSGSYVSNSFMSRAQIEELIFGEPADKSSQILRKDGLLVFLIDDPDCVRLNFYARDLDCLKHIPDIMPRLSKPLVADVVGKAGDIEGSARALEAVSFEEYGKFIRMSRSPLPEIRPDRNLLVESAREEDADDIVQALRCEFDPLLSRIPTRDQMTQAIGNGDVTLIRANGSIAGFAHFDRPSKMALLLRFFVVKKSYRGQRFGLALLANTFAEYPPSAACTLWIGTYNSSVGFYEKLGFKRDGMVDYIMKRKG